MDRRRTQLERWLERRFEGAADTLRPASEDASFRRYFRVTIDGQDFVVMDAPPETEPLAPFLKIGGWLSSFGLTVPEPVSLDRTAGFVVLTDLGRSSYLDALRSGADPQSLYPPALRALITLQVKGRAFCKQLPVYDRPHLTRELDLFWDWYWIRHLGKDLPQSVARLRRSVGRVLVDEARAQPQVFVHRDYHSRNLMTQGQPGILDFQDAVFGPITYDLVSLLEDCYVAWPEDQEAAWIESYRQAASASGLRLPAAADFRRAYDLMGIQRHLKAAGIFARLNYRDGKSQYLCDVPRTLAFVVRAAARYPILDDFADLILSSGAQLERLP